MARGRSLAWLSPLLFSYGAAHAALLVVPDQFTTIQSAISSASNGDTVLIRPGTYIESLAWSNKDLVITGGGGPDSVVVSGNFTARILTLGPGITGQTVLMNLTFRNGYADEGGGIKLIAASPMLQDCRFESNLAVLESEQISSKGGGMYVDGASEAVIEDCFFGSNRAQPPEPESIPLGIGGAIYVADEGDLEVRRCVFEDNVAYGFEGGIGGGIYVGRFTTALVESSTFSRNLGFGGGVYAEWDGNVTISECRFDGNYGYLGSALYLKRVYMVERSVFHHNEVFGDDGGIIFAVGPGQFISNTITFNIGRTYGGIDASVATMSRNIISHNQGWGVTQCVPQTFACNDVWGNELDGKPANYVCGDMTGINGNISLDPLFCAPQARDFSLDANSPCAGALNPCGLMGALDVGCGVLAVDSGGGSPSPWSRLTISPNPVFLTADLSVGGLGEGELIEIHDSAGRVVDVVGPVLSNPFQWHPHRGLASGVYFARARGKVAGSTRFVLIR